jgi:hypothetical protein
MYSLQYMTGDVVSRAIKGVINATMAAKATVVSKVIVATM